MYMPPMKTKKRGETVSQNKGLDATRRVFGNYDEKNNTASNSHYATSYKGEIHPSQPKPRVSSSTRHNKPHPEGVGFLMQDCATLHDPICDVKTKVNPQDTHWWPSRANQNSNTTPGYSKDSLSRSDYKAHQDRPKGLTRHGCNPHTMAAQGPVPVTQLPNPTGPRLLVEKISYEHGYNSRTSTNQPQRGKLHGNFVWDVFHPTAEPKNNTPNYSATPAGQRPSLPGRGSQGMRNIMTHDLTFEPNQAVRQARFPGLKKPLQDITSKVGEGASRIVRTEVAVEGLRHDTLPPTLPPIGS